MSFRKNKIIAIIPARGGSKGVPKKNIKPLNGKPLISYTINSALNSKYIDRVVVSTDNKEIAEIAKKYGAEVPFLRPAKLATDKALTLPVLQHAINYLENKEHYSPDLVILIQPTSPLLIADDIDLAIEQLFKAKANSCAAICEVSERPEWMRTFNKKTIKPFITETFKNRQDWPAVFRINGAVYVSKRDVIMKQNRILDEKPTAIIMPKERSLDIDESVDFHIVGAVLKISAK